MNQNSMPTTSAIRTMFSGVTIRSAPTTSSRIVTATVSTVAPR
jgi:hypothetical protein